jgi:hypothetical protein
MTHGNPRALEYGFANKHVALDPDGGPPSQDVGAGLARFDIGREEPIMAMSLT